jgi:hypothetical protein
MRGISMDICKRYITLVWFAIMMCTTKAILVETLFENTESKIALANETKNQVDIQLFDLGTQKEMLALSMEPGRKVLLTNDQVNEKTELYIRLLHKNGSQIDKKIIPIGSRLHRMSPYERLAIVIRVKGENGWREKLDVDEQYVFQK